MLKIQETFVIKHELNNADKFLNINNDCNQFKHVLMYLQFTSCGSLMYERVIFSQQNRITTNIGTWLMGLNIRLFRNFYTSNENFPLNNFYIQKSSLYFA